MVKFCHGNFQVFVLGRLFFGCVMATREQFVSGLSLGKGNLGSAPGVARTFLTSEKKVGRGFGERLGETH